jgi:hypothetical protein
MLKLQRTVELPSRRVHRARWLCPWCMRVVTRVTGPQTPTSPVTGCRQDWWKRVNIHTCGCYPSMDKTVGVAMPRGIVISLSTGSPTGDLIGARSSRKTRRMAVSNLGISSSRDFSTRGIKVSVELYPHDSTHDSPLRLLNVQSGHVKPSRSWICCQYYEFVSDIMNLLPILFISNLWICCL